MSTRGYVTLIDENKNIQMAAFLPSDAYLSYYGLEILDAIAECRFPEFIDKLQKDYPDELDMVDGIKRDWYIRGAKNKDDYFNDYAYEVNAETQVLTVYHYGDKALTIPYDQISLYHYIFEHDNELYYALCLDERTMTLRKDEYKEIRDMVKAGADISEFKALADKSSDIVFMNMGRMKDALCYNNDGFNKEVCLGSDFNKRLKFCVSEIFGDFGISLQTPFIRVPITSNLRSSAAAEKYIAKLCRDDPEAIRNTITLLNNIDAHLKEVKSLFNDIIPSNVPLEEHSNFILAEKKKEEMLATIDEAVKNPLIGKLEFYLKEGIKENFIRNYKQTRERLAKATKPLDDILADAEQRANNIKTNSQTPVKDVVNQQEGRW